MTSKKYLVTITKNKNKKASGILHKINCNNSNDIQVDFEPTTILSDLLDTVVYEGTSPYPQDNYSFKKDYLNHPFFLGCEFKGDTKFKEPLCYNFFFVAIDTLKEIIENNSVISMSVFELLRPYLDLKFTYTIELEELNPLYKYDKALPALIKNDCESEFQFVQLQHSYNYDTKIMFNDIDNTSHRFTYFCNDIEDIIFSVLHYLTLLKYNIFKKCNHCGKYFATKTQKQKYCYRNSPYPDFHHLDCEQAVRNIKQKFSRRYISIYKHLNNYYTAEVTNKFCKDYNKYKKDINKCSSVENLKFLDRFLDKDYIKLNWYKPEYRK